MLLKKQHQSNRILLMFLSLFSLLIIHQSCKKTDINDNQKSIIEKAAVDKFLTVPTGTNPTVNRIINTIKLQEDKFHFLDKIIEKEGFAMWQNARIMVPASSKKDILETATPGSSNPTTSTTSTNDTIVLIPLVLPNTTYVNSFISCNVNDTVGVRLYRGRDYSNHNFNKNADSLNAHKIALTCMNLEYETFQHNTFNVKDKRLLNYRPDAKEPSKTTITIRPPTATPTSWITIFFTYEIEVNNENPFDVVCPVGQACQWTHTETVFDSYTTWIADFGNWDGASFPNDPWGGSGYDPCGGTCTPVLDGWQYDPGPPPYQLSANDNRVINQLDAEDQETDNILSNSDCQGTLRTGNINFNGTKEHWLIQLDYIAKHPIGGEREYAIPNSSASGNRGYADLVNKVSREIFEIKPDNTQGKIDGETEVNRYVIKANQFCPSSPGPLPPTAPWLKGNNYTKTILPSTSPTEYLVADKIAPGVIGYKYEPKANNPSPLPVVIPSSVLDKLRTLVERLKANVNDANRIIAQYLAEHPELVTYIKSAAIGAAVAIVVGTIVEDFATAGVGILDDWASFTPAYRIVRVAWAL
jgi:hypothetical protein